MSRTVQFSAEQYTVKVYPKNDYGEHMVRVFIQGRKYPPADYFTDDRQDAIGTAQVMLQRLIKGQ